jgi:4-aminobutyrate aminotransferase
MENAVARGHQVLRALEPLVDQYPGIVRDVRGKGLMIGIQFDSGETADAVQMQAFDRGLLVLEAGDNCVRMSPPLVVTQGETDTAIRLFTQAVEHVAGHRAEDVAERKASQRAGYATEGFGASGR